VKPPTETALVKACLQLLTLRGIPAWRQNTLAAAFGSGPGRRYVRSGPAGTSDVLGVLPPSGRLLALECKRPGNHPTAAQLAFLRAVRAAAGWRSSPTASATCATHSTGKACREHTRPADAT
jgi:hypothetical protein